MTLVAAVASAVPVSAQVTMKKSYKRDMQVSRSGDKLVVSASFPEVFDKRLREKILKGFKVPLLVDVSLRTGEKPVAQTLIRYDIRYDIWDERFYVRVQDASGSRVHKLRTMQDVVDRCGRLEEMQMQPLVEVPDGAKCQLKAQITVHPLSEVMRRRIEGSIANGPRKMSSTSSLFRGYVKLKNFGPDAVFTYRSQRFVLPAKE